MRLFLLTLIFFLTSLAIAQNPADRRIQNDPAAQELLDRVSSKYNAAASLKVNFSLMVDTPDEDAYMKSKGMVYLKKDKYKIDTEEMLIICDNVKRYVYLKESNELQINFFEPEEDEIESPSELFEIYKKDYFYRLSGEITDNNRKLSVVSLLPADIRQSPYKMILLYVDKEKNQIVKGEILAKDGIKYTYTISSVEESPVLDSEFTFDPSDYPGIYVDDMTK
ncbi:MAG TPA: outer membrane lipoprotein carrier protein LolA [Chitinophagales bacterium]|nr:outer membrane lipoprotein carrier protein LolA [Chitinophagales bacterium]